MGAWLLFERDQKTMTAVTLSRTKVPFADLQAQYLSLKPEMDQAIADVIAQSAFIRGPYVDRFEGEFASAMGTSHCVSTANGTDSLYIAMHALGVQPGDEVIVPAMSWISTSETVTQAGGTVVFCDIDPASCTIDIEQLASLVTDRTVGIIPVHLYGQPADMDGVMALAERHGLWVIEDCAQAHYATWKGQTVGTIGTIGSFSFYPGKNLGAMGDAGAAITRDPALADGMAMFARHGGLKKGDHVIEGINSRLDGLQAAVLSVKLPHLRSWTDRRRSIAKQYDAALAGLPGLGVPVEVRGSENVYHLYVVRHAARDALARHLADRNVQTVINYPRALPFLPCYARFEARPEDFPASWALQNECLSLPIFPEMADDQVKAVIDAVSEFCLSSGAQD
jgi:dTDP-4-amino-4,6-dideoxygalactose transaminase